jgi:hypothetical protein
MIGTKFNKLPFVYYLVSFEDDVSNLCLVLADAAEKHLTMNG